MPVHRLRSYASHKSLELLSMRGRYDDNGNRHGGRQMGGAAFIDGNSPSESWKSFKLKSNFLLPTCSLHSQAIHLTTYLNRGGSKTSVVPFCS
jgi:hypothetical protein